MGRNYRIVVSTPKGPRFSDTGGEFDMNVAGVQYYGQIMQELALPVENLSHTLPGYIGFKHEYKGEDLGRVRTAVETPGFRDELIKAIKVANRKVGDLTEVVPDEETADYMLQQIFPLFLRKEAIAVASDYCEEYYDNIEDMDAEGPSTK